MARKSKLIPFKFMPASWGLSGKAYEEAELAYYYDGEEFDRKLIDIRYERGTTAYKQALLDHHRIHRLITKVAYDLGELELSNKFTKDTLDFEISRLDIMLQHNEITKYDYDRFLAEAKYKYGDKEMPLEYDLLFVDRKHDKISQYDFDVKCAQYENTNNEPRLELALLEIEFAHHKISEHDFNKKRSTLLEEPWIGIINQGFDPDKGLDGVFFEFDWNDYWIEYLKLNGYNGISEEHIVELWFADVCRTQGLNTSHASLDSGVIPFSSRAVNLSSSDD